MTPGDNLEDQISALPTPGSWVSLNGLVACVLRYLSTQEGPPQASLACNSISLLGSGSYNYVYRLSFSSGDDLAASIPKADEELFCPSARLSEIATIRFVKESGLYPDIPVPRIHAWHPGFDNDAGVPWTLMDVIDGVLVDSEHAEGRGVGVTGFDLLAEEKQMALVEALAALQAHLSKPVPFREIGSIYFRDERSIRFKIGPLTSFGQSSNHISAGGPYTSLPHMYTTLLEGYMSHAMRTWCSLPTDAIADSFPTNLTPRIFSDLYHMLTSLVPQFALPPSSSILVLHHPDIALRNVLFDEESLKAGKPRITGVLDWAGAQVLPLMLTATYPGELMSNAVTPFHPPIFRGSPRPDPTHWPGNTVAFNWTSIGNSEVDWPRPMGGPVPDHGPALAAQVRRFYLRTYFSACYATQMQEMYSDADLARASVFRDAEYYLKFHAVVCTHPSGWQIYESWVKETYWRLRLNSKPGAIIGPNVYHGQVEKPVRDLRMLEQEQDQWVRTFEAKSEENTSDGDSHSGDDDDSSNDGEQVA